MSEPIFSATPQTNPFGLANVDNRASPTFADIDGDGDMDAFVGNNNGATVFFHNTGSANAPKFENNPDNFGLTDIGTYADPTFADIDGDGDLDAFVGNYDGDTVIFHNTGSATKPVFVKASGNFGLADVGYLAAPTFADIDGDGDLDAFVGEKNNDPVFFLNTGSASAPKFTQESGNFGLGNVATYSSPSFADIDGDGDLDAFVGNRAGETFFFRNTGSASVPVFTQESANFGLGKVDNYASPTFADIDGDGDLDAFVGNLNGNTVFFQNDQAGVKITPSDGRNTVTEGGATDTYSVVLNRQPTANVTITLDNTNNQVNTDKITLTFTADNWNVAQTVTLTAVNDSTGEGKHTSAIKHTVTSTDANYNGLAVKPVAVTILDNDLPKVANPSFVLAATPSGLSSNGVPVASFADIDGDGDIDVFIGGTDGNTRFFRNTGTSVSPNFVSQSNSFGLTDVGISAAPAFADIDGDGDLDAFIGERYGSMVFFRNKGTALAPSFVKEANNFGLIQESGSARPAFADIDGDGDMDAFVGTGDGTLRFFRNVGTANAPSFIKQGNNLGLTSTGASASPSFADLDGDGDLDAVIGKSDGSTIYFKNIGNATKPNFSVVGANVFGLSVAGVRYTSATFADLDGDGDLDALLSYNGGFTYLSNNIPGIKITQSGGTTAVTEGGANDSYTIVLGSIPTADVTITLDNTNNQVNTNTNTLTFTAANWNIPQTVTLTAANDAIGECQHTGVIKHTVTSADATYNGMVINPVIVTITDNDLKQGNPGFNAPVFNAFGLQKTVSNASPTFADIDGDGDLDAFIGNKYGETLFYRNTGTATAPNFAFQSNNFGLADVGDNAKPAFADIDGDGDLDAFVGKLDGTVQYFRNNGNADAPQFVAQTTTLGLADVGSKANPTFADIDNDGDLDAFVGKGQSGAVAFFRNTGTANAAKFVSEANSFGLNSVSSNSSPTLVDWDGDGDLDAIVGDFIATTFLRNIGTKTVPNFVSQTSTFGLSDDGFSHNPTLVDIDGDGDLDAFVGFGYGDTAFYLNTPPGITIRQTGNSTAVTEGGATDTFTVVLASIPKANVTITLDNTNNQVNTNIITLTFTAANWNIPQTVILTAVNDTVGEGKHNGVITYKVSSTDPDYNGMVVKPLAVTITDNDLATGNPNFDTDQTNPFGLKTGNDGFIKPRFADIDGDGDLDLFAGFRYGDIQFYRNTGTANAPAFASPFNTNRIGLLGPSGGYNSPSFADIDGDGDLDAFIGGADGKLHFSRNVGSAVAPAFVSQTATFGIGDVGSYANPTFADIDSDGDLDVFIGANDGKTQFFRNIGTANNPSFVKQANNFGIADVGFGSAYPSLVDFDGDGDLDAVVGDFFGNSQFFRNIGTATAPSFSKVIGSFGIPEVGDYAHPTFVDIDGDGDLDAFIGEDGFETPIHFFENTVRSRPVLAIPADIIYTDTRFDDTFATKNGNLVATDANGNSLTYGIQGGSDLGNGTVRLANSFGTLTVTKATGAYSFVANDSTIEALIANSVTNFTVTVSDGLLSTSKTLTLRINQSGVTETNGNDTLLGTAGSDKFNALAGDDTINGGAGADNMIGGLGKDTYVVDNVGDKVIETSALATEIDKVLSSISHTLSGNVENLTLTGTNSVNGTGNSLNNTIVGNSGANILNGQGGIDTLTGGLGKDTYVVDNVGDKVIENSALATEIDQVLSSISHTLSGNVENLTLTGTNSVNGTGNSINNTIVGNGGANILNGLGGIDTLTGGLGKDIFQLTTLTRDRITDFNVADDTIRLENGVFTKLTATGGLSTNFFKIGAATDADDFILYNSATGILTYDSNGNGAGGATQIAVLGVGLGLTNADFGVI